MTQIDTKSIIFIVTTISMILTLTLLNLTVDGFSQTQKYQFSKLIIITK